MKALNTLAARYGIEEAFRDARGTLQSTTPATRLALLAAMGADATTEDAALAAVDAMDRDAWLHPLPPAHVTVAADVLSVPIAYPAATDTLTWRLLLEDGEELSGQARFHSLQLLHRHELDAQPYERRSLLLDAKIPCGYHQLKLEPGDAKTTLIVSPGQCWLPDSIAGGKRVWGVAAQLYLLKSNSNWGIGDFSDLRDLARLLVTRGADAIGLNPLHALFADDPDHASPYSPASRLLLNYLNIDVMSVAEASGCTEATQAIRGDEFQRELRACRDSSTVEYSRVARLKIPVLKMIFRSCAAQPLSLQWQAFESFRRGADKSFTRHCLFLALREHFAAQRPPLPDWREWPVELRDPVSSAVQAFAKDQHELLSFQFFLQFVADMQLAEAASAAASMAIGLYRDLAVGADPSGAETWSNQQSVVAAAQVGAPPDIYNPAGQDWGLPPFHPMALRREGYRSFIDLLRANMRHAGGLRIDHVMALQQLYWVPRGSTAAQGAYVRYPREDLINILALESQRSRCLVVGEDLGTVPEGFRERMAEARILSYRVLFFEKDLGGFIAPQCYPALSLAVAGSHDLPTLRAWMAASDLELKDTLGLFPNAKLKKDAHLDRFYDRRELLAAFGERGLASEPDMSPAEFADAAHAFLASSASAITMVQVDDITREATPVNVPATSTENPNWRRRLSMSVEQIADDSEFRALTRLMNESRASLSAVSPAVPSRSSGEARWGATYRLQLHNDFPLAAAIKILPYLKALGISHVYVSPCLQASPGSQHGYDVTDATKISDDLGGEAAWEQFVAAARAQSLGILLDIVPNHMAATARNAWWDDLLAHGAYSRFAAFFDVRTTDGPFKIQLCSLGRPYGEVLKAGEFKLALIEGRPRITYFDNTWPLAAASWGELLEQPSADCFVRLAELQGIASPSAAEYEGFHSSHLQAQALLETEARSGVLMHLIELANNDPARLNAILSRQYYELHSWTLSGELTNYRRFFEVDALVGVRTELESVFTATHARIEKMLSGSELDGLRVDHPDGLAEPKEYFRRLRSLLPDGRIYVEKILENDERLDAAWHLDGTVGYDFLAKANRLWMDDSHTDALTSIYNDFTGHSVNVGALVRQKQREVLDTAFFGEMDRLTHMLVRIARSDCDTSDLSPRYLREGLAAATAALPIYRTYRTGAMIDANDARTLRESVRTARFASPQIDSAIFDFLEALFCRPRLDERETDFVTKWQQLTPAVMAKGVEDTTFYVFDRLLSCNEVGASASMLGISSEKFHEYCHYLSEHWPHNLLATSTHDNKRSEDVRTRISLLSEMPERWAQMLQQWSKLNGDAWRNRNPDRHAEYLLYQTLIGAWPISQERCWQYMLKALREAKINTSWHKANPAYEEKIQIFVENVYKNDEFIASLENFVAPLVLPGRINSLAQTLLKLVTPGVPDFYQGTELWDLSLVDPDNRRPVDYELRLRLLADSDRMGAPDALREWDSGVPKLWMISRVLKFRAEHPQLFAADSKYSPIVASGSRLSNLFSCCRGGRLIAVVPRFGMSVAGDWQDTRLPLPEGQWRSLLSDASVSESVAPAQLFADFPVALLFRVDPRPGAS